MIAVLKAKTHTRISYRYMGIEEILKDVKIICKKYKAKKVILFGSYAKGTAVLYSDIDIAVSGVELIPTGSPREVLRKAF